MAVQNLYTARDLYQAKQANIAVCKENSSIINPILAIYQAIDFSEVLKYCSKALKITILSNKYYLLSDETGNPEETIDHVKIKQYQDIFKAIEQEYRQNAEKMKKLAPTVNNSKNQLSISKSDIIVGLICIALILPMIIGFFYLIKGVRSTSKLKKEINKTQETIDTYRQLNCFIQKELSAHIDFNL